MKNIPLLCAALLAAPLSVYASTPATSLAVARYTLRTDGFVTVESGYLNVPEGFRAQSSGAVTRAELGVSLSTLNAISGRTITRKAIVDNFDDLDPVILSNYSFSSQTYEVAGSLVVIARIDEGGGGDGGSSEPIVTVSATDTSIPERPSTPSTVRFRLSKAAPERLNIHFKVSGNAKPGHDYNITNDHVVQISKGDTQGTIRIRSLYNAVNEENERVIVTIENGNGYRVGARDSAKVTIVDD